MQRFLSILILLSFPVLAVATESKPFIQSGQRIVFLGDSNTHFGHYITLLETWLRFHHPEGEWILINLGLPGETASGLSEPAHPFPRPCIHMRLKSALHKSKPDVVVLGYGTNDGIYYPFSEKRFSAYRDGNRKLIATCRQTGAKIILFTPPPFDPEPLRKKGQIKPAGADEYGWLAVFEGYDDVMARYAQWILTQADAVDIVIDIRTPMVTEMLRPQRQDTKATVVPDGVHYSLDGHGIVASRLWGAWNLTPTKPADGPNEEWFRIVSCRQRLLHDAWLTHVGHSFPGMKAGLPLDEAKAQANKILDMIHDVP